MNLIGNHYQNPTPRPRRQSLFGLLKFLSKVKWGQWPKWVENTEHPALRAPNEPYPVVTFINHASFLFQIADQNILIDPVFCNRVGPAGLIGPSRVRHPGLTFETLPKIDAVLITHNHYDHLDLSAVRRLHKHHHPIFLVPAGMKPWFRRRNIAQIIELDWWAQHQLSETVSCTFTPSQHFSGRGIFDGNRTLWGGWMIQSAESTIYHAGDTGYGPHFKQIGERFKIDLACLPIGDYAPKELLNFVHMSPDQAIQAYIDLGARQAFGMHQETFRLSGTDFCQGQHELEHLLHQQPGINFSVPAVGSSHRLTQN